MKTIPDPNSAGFRSEARRIEESVAKAFNMDEIAISFHCCPPRLIFTVKPGAESPADITGPLLANKMTAAISDDSELMAIAVEGQTFSAEGD